MKRIINTLFLACTLAMPALAQTPAERNQAIKQAINTNTITFSAAAQQKPKASTAFLCQFNAASDAEFVNSDIEVTYKMGGKQDVMVSKCTPSMFITVKNRTNRIIYLDLENSFIVVGDDSRPMYQPKETVTTVDESKTNAVSLKTKTGQLQTVSGTNKETVTTTAVISQRVVAIPPRGSKMLEEQRLFPKNYPNGIVMHVSTNDDDYLSLSIPVGSALEWTEQTSPLKIGGYITYAFNKDLTQEGATVGGELFLRKVWGQNTPLTSIASFESWSNKIFTGIQPGQIIFPMTSYMLSTKQLQTWGGVSVEK